MLNRRVRWRPGFTLVELLVVMAIISILMSLMVGAVFQAQVAAKALQCDNNLRNLGLACHNYHTTMKVLPTENGSGASLYTTLLPYIEEQVVADLLDQGNAQARSAPIGVFLCPGRRTASNAPGKRDYGYALSPNNSSIFDIPGGGNLSMISSAAGAGKTALLTHVWMDPNNYIAGDPTDQGWYYQQNSRSNNSVCKLDKDQTGDTTMIGGPHPNAMPVVFADTHIERVPLKYTGWSMIWAWNNRAIAPPRN